MGYLLWVALHKKFPTAVLYVDPTVRAPVF